VLVIENDTATVGVIREALADGRNDSFNIECAVTLSDGLERLTAGGIKAIMLNLFLPDSRGIETFNKVFLLAHQIPIMIISDPDHEESARQAIQLGARDYILKDHIDGYSLSHSLRNVMARRMAEEALFIEKERAQVTLNSIGDAVISVDIAANITFLNLVAERMTGWPREEAIGRPLDDVLRIIDAVTHEPARSPIELALAHNKVVSLSTNCNLIRRDGFEAAIEDTAAPIHDRDGQVIGAVMVFHDVSASRAMVLKMSHLAQHDYLTDLPNRVLLNDRLTQAIFLARRHHKRLAVLFLDLDLFKNINDSLGHLVGDELLVSIAGRLLSCVRSSDTISRQGGDEFIILLSEIEHTNDVVLRAENVITVLAGSHSIGEHDIDITVSIGISVFPENGECAEVLIRNADAAMYHAKQNGRNRYQFFRQGFIDAVDERHATETSL
jgi:diguanylate cyclase (GGDEF)-like protein/PAS domain S-box-containing protein